MFSYKLLLPIDPISTDCGDIESLSGYFMRQADLLMLSGHKLTRKLMYKHELQINRKVGPFGPSSYYTCSANGCGELSEAYISAASISSTLTFDFKRMTLFGLRNSVNQVGNKLNGPHRRWCSECWREDLCSGRALYSRLLWSIDIYDACIHHKETLSMVCPHCSEFQYAYPTLPRAHVCDYCGLDLFDEQPGIQLLPQDKSLWVSRALHKLVERTSVAGVEISDTALPNAIRHLSERFAGKNSLALANALNFGATTLRDWEAGVLKPHLPKLLDFCYRLDIPPDQLLLDKSILTHPTYWRRLRTDYIYTHSILPSYMYDEILEYLDNAVVENPYPPHQPSKIAIHFQIFPMLLRSRFRTQYTILNERWMDYYNNHVLVERRLAYESVQGGGE